MSNDLRHSLPRTETKSTEVGVEGSQDRGEGVRKRVESAPLVDTHVNPLSPGMIKLYGVWCVPLLATFMAGYGVSSMTAINPMPSYQNYFKFRDVGVSTGLIFAMWPIAACSLFWLGPILADRLGRKGGMFISSLVYVVGTCLLAFARGFAMLLAGRFFLGAAVGLMQPAAPPYIVELAPPLNRGLLTGLFNCCWLLGSALATLVSIFSNDIQTDWSWRLPLTLQLIPPIIMASAVLFLPESPRWLFAHGKPDQAKAVLSKYHGNGSYTPLVAKELDQIVVSLETSPKKMFDYSNLANTKGKAYRVMLALLMGAFGQLSGNTLMIFAPSLYKQVGMKSVRQQLIMTLIPTLVGLGSAILGTYCTDRLGRRPMLTFGTFLCALFLAFAMACSAISLNGRATISVQNYNDAAAKGTIAFLILFYAAYSWAYIPLVAVYPPEVLSMEQRSTGMGLMVLTLNLASVLGQLTTPIALQKIGWWTYLPWVCWDLIETVVWYCLAVETKGRTLEELDQIFDAVNPVRSSLVVAGKEQG
ncbi:uncharacterized protein I206_105429 [Kwoniella pini CBS 10737]|uniref:Major facilitator superfamily (MFS) profile domain-containing protein n=1 Tax=Kwoniella pini CBS 10737 TaxID=1296096 RepID=A0A1B9I497_9TREE|nr:uncharacterized protein I206_03665 [Kwoniella pini CBS 10737]OCF50346.1 hypothetical protein I206_03665 [Kwoniella pini CBS 10737]